jgi:prepilin-type N-terminal cleavage/methylation domain-containing protein
MGYGETAGSGRVLAMQNTGTALRGVVSESPSIPFLPSTMFVFRRRGFTLIELLVVVVILGVLAMIAIPKLQNTRGRGNAATLRADLRSLSTAQEAYFYEHGTYTNQPDALNLDSSPGVVLTIFAASAHGWSATVTHPQSFPLTCALFSGNVEPIPPAVHEGLIACQ